MIEVQLHVHVRDDRGVIRLDHPLLRSSNHIDKRRSRVVVAFRQLQMIFPIFAKHLSTLLQRHDDHPDYRADLIGEEENCVDHQGPPIDHYIHRIARTSRCQTGSIRRGVIIDVTDHAVIFNQFSPSARRLEREREITYRYSKRKGRKYCRSHKRRPPSDRISFCREREKSAVFALSTKEKLTATICCKANEM